MTPDIAQAQDALVKALASAPSEPWERIVANWEIGDDGGKDDLSTIAFCICRAEDGSLGETDLKLLPPTVPERLLALRALMAERGDRWSTCDLAIDRDGRYEFHFAYGPPKRLNGIIDDESYYRFSRYLDDYRAGRKTLSTEASQ